MVAPELDKNLLLYRLHRALMERYQDDSYALRRDQDQDDNALAHAIAQDLV